MARRGVERCGWAIRPEAIWEESPLSFGSRRPRYLKTTSRAPPRVYPPHFFPDSWRLAPHAAARQALPAHLASLSWAGGRPHGGVSGTTAHLVRCLQLVSTLLVGPPLRPACPVSSPRQRLLCTEGGLLPSLLLQLQPSHHSWYFVAKPGLHGATGKAGGVAGLPGCPPAPRPVRRIHKVVHRC